MRFTCFLIALCVVPAVARAQNSSKKCSGTAPDTTLVPRVYRDCEVDKPANLRGSEPRLAYTPSTTADRANGCHIADLEFVVDTLGSPEPLSVTAKAGNDRDLQDAVVARLHDLRYRPAMLGGHPVRQLVTYRRWIYAMTLVSTSPTMRPPMPSGPAPRC